MYNFEELILCALPYHETHAFVKIVQLINFGLVYCNSSVVYFILLKLVESDSLIYCGLEIVSGNF